VALATYAAAVVLLFASNMALVYGAAGVLAHGRADRIDSLASEFARSVPGILCAGFVSSAALGLTALASARLQGRRIIDRLRLGPSRTSLAGTAAAVAGTLGLGLASGSLADLLGLGRTSSMNTIARVLAHASMPQVGGALLTIAILPAVAEETLFRGLIQGLFVARLGRWTGIVVAAALFGLVHLDVVQGTLAAVVGLFLGWVAERLGGIRPGMLAHAVNNALFILTSIAPTADCPSRRTLWVLAAAGSFGWAAAIMVLRHSAAVHQKVRDFAGAD
jgi:membrane protease YdiL (CAAX protease family)